MPNPLRAVPGALFAVVLLLGALNARVYGQSHQPPASSLLPDAPQAAVPPGPVQPESDDKAVISGTVVDTNGGVIQGARVAVRRNSGADAHIMETGGDGQFAFNDLPAGPYKLTVTAPGMSTYASPQIDLTAGQILILPQIVLNVTAAESITVTADKEELSQEQVQIAIQQRVLGVIPNFYMTFDWDAPPMLAKQKFKLSLRSTFDPTAFVVMAGVAGAEQYKNVFPGFGGGLEGYGKRYGATFANHISDQTFSRAIYPAIFHQDPRYFYKGKGSIRSRALYAMSNVVITRGDNGHWQPNYSGVLGKFTSAAISNLYYPESERGAHLVYFNGLTEMGSEAVDNLIKEFILKDLTSHIPKGANGER